MGVKSACLMTSLDFPILILKCFNTQIQYSPKSMMVYEKEIWQVDVAPKRVRAWSPKDVNGFYADS
jgi:hypothetical protein